MGGKRRGEKGSDGKGRKRGVRAVPD